MHSCGINHLGQLGVLHLSTREKPWTESTHSLHQTHPCLQDGSGYARLAITYEKARPGLRRIKYFNLDQKSTYYSISSNVLPSGRVPGIR